MKKILRKKEALYYSAVVATAISVMAIGWLFTPLPTMVAWYVWNHYGDSALTLTLDRSDAQLAFDIGNRAFGQGSYDVPLAERAYRQAVAIEPKLLFGHYQLARVLFVEAEFAEAETQIDTELTSNPENLRALYVRALIRAYNHDLAGAADDFERFTNWAPSEWAGYNDLAWVLGQEGKYAEAKTALLRGLAKARDAANNPWLWNNLGVQELNLKEYQNAVASFEKAKSFAANLDERSWKAAYPGNDPAGSAGGIQAFQAAIEANLASVNSASANFR